MWSLRKHKFETRLSFLNQFLNQSANTIRVTITAPQEPNDGNQHPCVYLEVVPDREAMYREKVKKNLLVIFFHQRSSVRIL